MNKHTITMATYKFSEYGNVHFIFCGMELVVETYPITNETDREYIICKPNNTKGKIAKNEIGKITHHMNDNFPYIRIFLIDKTEEDARNAIAKWFEDKANQIRKKYCMQTK